MSGKLGNGYTMTSSGFGGLAATPMHAGKPYRDRGPQYHFVRPGRRSSAACRCKHRSVRTIARWIGGGCRHPALGAQTVVRPRWTWESWLGKWPPNLLSRDEIRRASPPGANVPAMQRFAQIASGFFLFADTEGAQSLPRIATDATAKLAFRCVSADEGVGSSSGAVAAIGLPKRSGSASHTRCAPSSSLPQPG